MGISKKEHLDREIEIIDTLIELSELNDEPDYLSQELQRRFKLGSDEAFAYVENFLSPYEQAE